MKTQRLLMLILVVTIAPSDAINAQDAAKGKHSIEVASLSVAKAKPGSEFAESLSPYQRAGIEVELYFQTPGMTVLAMNQEKSQLTLATQDGTELPLAEGFDGILDLQINDEAESGIVKLRSDNPPAPNTQRLVVTGNVVLVAGEAPKTEEVVLNVKPDAAIRIAGIDATITEIGDAFAEPFKKSITLRTKKKLDVVKSIEFLSMSGKPIESSPSGTSYFGFGDDFTYDSSYEIASDDPQVKLKITWFTKSSEHTIPVKLDFGPGL
ncbi:MAG: hypothetical protein KDA85_09455 [Planctomycetaceae bacterium]|nr:hypothetical protein [Planctomycetaceae bacterium]